MSAWFIFSSFGFFSVASGSTENALGSRAINKATINLDNGNSFTVIGSNQSAGNVFFKGRP